MKIHINRQVFDIPEEGKNLLEICLQLGFDVPYFCWHPAFNSVGACRQCAVKTFERNGDDHGKLQMACMIQPKEEMRVDIEDPEAVAFRAGIIEWMMLNHPHDCPVCDEGGECHLQDMTVMTGHVRRRTCFPKRTFNNQYLGPFIHQEMNRCIQCFRCVRFYREYAGGRDFDAMGSHDHLFFGRAHDGVLENEFSGNLVEVCPTGVFTDKSFRKHFTRKWDLRTAPSLCEHCGVGCNTIPGEHKGILRRIRTRYHGQVNGYFICDRGRFGYEYVNGRERIRKPRCRNKNGDPVSIEPDAAIAMAADWMKQGNVIGVGSPRASLESNYALARLVGWDRFLQGMTEAQYRLTRLIQNTLQKGPCPSASLQEADNSDAVFILGEDVTNTAPMLALALRQAMLEKPMADAEARQNIPKWEDAILRESVQQEKGPFFVAAPFATKFDDAATETYHAAPQDLARLGFAVAHAIDPEAPGVPDLARPVRELAERIAKTLLEGERPIVVSGVTCGSEALIEAAANVAWALHTKKPTTKLCYTVPECNSMGLAFFPGAHVAEALEAVQNGTADTLVVVENDLYRHFNERTVDELLEQSERVIVIDSVSHRTAEKADLVLPAAVVAESNGTLVNNEGRAQRYYQVYPPDEAIQPSWRWIGLIGREVHQERKAYWISLRDLVGEMASEIEELAPVAELKPEADFRRCGLRVPRESHRRSGRTAEHADQSVHEPQPPVDSETPLSFSMEGSDRQPPPELISRYWAPGWNSNQALNKFQSELAGSLRGGDPGLRILRKGASGDCHYFASDCPPFARRSGESLVIPAFHIFGSGELSALAPAIQERIPEPYIGMNPEDAERMAVTRGDMLGLKIAGEILRAPVSIVSSVPAGVVTVPVGLPKMPGIFLPSWGDIVVHARKGDEKEGAKPQNNSGKDA